jgi:hypothetical protein
VQAGRDATLCAMKGRKSFTNEEAVAIRRLLALVRRAEPGTPQKVLRDKLRAFGFYISDFGGVGFTPADFDDLVCIGRVIITDGRDQRFGAADDHAQPMPATAPKRARQPRRTTVTATAVESGDAWAASAMTALSSAPLSIKRARAGAVPDRPGLYALYGSEATWKLLGLGKPPDRRPLYVGKAEASLVSRDLQTHFATGATGRSSPRRSFAALLAGEGVLDLVAIPRRPADPEPDKWTHFALEATGDEQLTDWMAARLSIAVWIKPAQAVLKTIESRVMSAWLPPLNLTGVSTPWTSDVKAARTAMAEAGKRWAASRALVD